MPIQDAAVDSAPDGDDIPLDQLMEIETLDSNYNSNYNSNNELELEELLSVPVESPPAHFSERGDRRNDCGICFIGQPVGAIILLSGINNGQAGLVARALVKGKTGRALFQISPYES